ncbi:6-bladed beta-propeller [Parabacteroides pacaensis]|uniref:6-bladed beta-propeller n=1 Tax=Parabacteroides pacaensis TaxID=2086575 RepID=UPI000D0FE0A7|nr:6-bladed beta-propeller [Parabacteroides pacaensis]
MKKTEAVTLGLSFCISLLILVGCKSNQSGDTEGKQAVIHVEEAYQNPVQLTLSDLGDDLEYIPLETTDSSIVAISSVTTMAVSDKLIIIGARNVPLKAFDKKSGRYIGQIGSIGGGPTEYPNGTNFQIDPKTNKIYVRVTNNKYQCYDASGKFLKTVTWDELAKGVAVTPYFLEDQLYSYVNIPTNFTTVLSYLYNLQTGEKIDSLRWKEELPEKGCKILVPLAGSEIFGGRALLGQLDNEKWTYGNQKNTGYWYLNNRLYMKNVYCDTVFTVKGFDNLKPRMIFDMGKLGGFTRYEKSDAMTNKFIITRVLETENIIYFTMMKNLFDLQGWQKGMYNPPYYGVYNKQTGLTKIMEGGAIKNNVEGLPGFTVYNTSTKGELVVCLQSGDLMEAREKIPASEQPEWLKQLKEEDNPVILLIQ